MMEVTLSLELLRETRQRPMCQVREVLANGKTCTALAEESLSRLEHVGAVSVVGDEVHITQEQRLRIAELAIARGADPEKIARQLRWQEFEALIKQVLTRSGFLTVNHLVFKGSGRRYEIDVLGAKEPMVLCIDCKHWHRGWAPSKLLTAATNQLERVLVLSRLFMALQRKLPAIAKWRSTRLLPVVLTLADVSSKLMNGVPIVSVWRFRDFLSEVNPWVESLRFVDAWTCEQTRLDSR